MSRQIRLLPEEWPELAAAAGVAAKKAGPEELFLAQVQQFKNLECVPQYHFAKSIGRQWRFDFAFPAFNLAVELEGLIPMSVWKAKLAGPEPLSSNGCVINVTAVEKLFVVLGRHASITGIKGDMEKYNTAALLGWQVLRFEQKAVKPRHAIDMTLQVLAARGWRYA